MPDTLSPEDWQRVEALFHVAADLPRAAQAAFVAEQCADAPQVKAEVSALLAASSGDTGLAGSIAAETGQLPAGGLAAGDRLGAYRITHKLDEGGMGAVYAAERADGSFDQRVAIKVLHAGLASADLIQRFETERQILAGLAHPNIARLIDGGATEHGLPYLVMEFIEGEPITAYCDAHVLDITERLALMQTLCDAVQAAHRNLVVHRDIKPSNVLVQADGTLKLLDFGIAKLLDTTPVADDATRIHTRMMTPDYASPEQIRGEAITLATDIYGLGALLYRLLTGVAPFHAFRTQPLELQKAICETTPARPSTTKPSDTLGSVALAWPRNASADLDAIVLRAMRIAPAERYASAAALADDIGNYLGNRPVQARRGNRRYLARKYVQRNAKALAATTAVLAVLIGVVANYTVRLNAERAAAVAARDLAVTEQAAAARVSEFVVSLFEGANTDKNRPDLRASDLLDAGLDRVDTELADTPALRARLLFALGHAYWTLGQRELGEARMREGIALLSLDQSDQALVAAGFMTDLSAELIIPERFDPAEALLRQAMTIYETELGPNDPKVAEMIMDIDRIWGQRDHDTSMARFEATERARRIYEAAGMERSKGYVSVVSRQAGWHKQRFEWGQALPMARRAVVLDERIHPKDHFALFANIENLGRMEYFAGDYRRARPRFERGIRIVEAFKGADSLEMSWSLYYLARIDREVGAAAEARAGFERLVAIERATPTTADNRYLARALCGLALVLADAGELEAAQRAAAEGRDLLAASAQQRVQLDVAHEALGIVALARGDIASALAEFEALTTLRRKEHDPAQTDTPLAIAQYASALAADGQASAALALFDQAIALAGTRYGADYLTIGKARWARAFVHEAAGRSDAAAVDREEARRILDLQDVAAQTITWLIPTEDVVNR